MTNREKEWYELFGDAVRRKCLERQLALSS